MYTITKTYGNNLGLSATFRQWRADSHCRFVHGYALGFELILGCKDHELNEQNWVYSFGGLKTFKAWLEDTFDHKTVVAEDDPLLESFEALDTAGMIQLRIVEAVGCEKFAKMAYDRMLNLIVTENQQHRVNVLSVKCFEHAGNAATYHGADVRGYLGYL